MKSACIALVVICALQFVHSDDTIPTLPSDVRPNKNIEHTARQSIELTKDAANLLELKVSRFNDETDQTLIDIRKSGYDALNSILIKAQSTRYSRIEYDLCFEEHMAEIEKNLADGKHGVSECIEIAMSRVEELSEIFIAYVTAIDTWANNIQGIVDNCSTTPDLAGCITTHLAEINRAILGITSLGQDAITFGINEYGQLSGTASVCAKTVTDAVDAEVQKIALKCIDRANKL